jgi:chromosome segregation ATPase
MPRKIMRNCKTLIFQTILILTFIGGIAFALPSYSQTSNSPNAPNSKSKPTNQKTIDFLLDQIDGANTVIEANKTNIAALEAEIKLEKENSASLNNSYEAAKREIVALRTANDALQKAVELNNQTITLLKSDNEALKLKNKRLKKDKLRAYAVALGIFLIKVL